MFSTRTCSSSLSLHRLSSSSLIFLLDLIPSPDTELSFIHPCSLFISICVREESKHKVNWYLNANAIFTQIKLEEKYLNLVLKFYSLTLGEWNLMFIGSFPGLVDRIVQKLPKGFSQNFVKGQVKLQHKFRERGGSKDFFITLFKIAHFLSFWPICPGNNS